MHPDSPTPQLLDRALTRWGRELSDLGGHDDLLELDEASPSLLDLGMAHPNGLAGFLAGRVTRLSTLYREPAALQAARARARHLSLAANRLVDTYGLPGAHLATGVFTWAYPTGRGPVRAPVLLRPISLVPRGSGADVDYELEPAEQVRLNPALVRLLGGAGVDLSSVADYAEEGDDHAVSARRILEEVRAAVVDLPVRLHDRTLVGTFVELGPAMLDDLHAVSGLVATNRTITTLLTTRPDRGSDPSARPGRLPAADSGAGSGAEEARGAASSGGLRWSVTPPTPEPPPAEQPARTGRAALLDPAQLEVLARVESQADLRVEAPAGSGVTETAAAIVESVAACNGRVLVVAPTRDELSALQQRLSMPVDSRDAQQGEAAHARLHTVDQQWGMSRFAVLRRLVELGADGHEESVHLTRETLTALTTGREAAAQLLARGAEVGALAPSAVESPWAGAVIEDDAAAARARQAVGRLLDSLPAATASMTRLAQGVKMRPGRSLAEWTAQLEVFSSVRSTLDLFTPAVYERVTPQMLAATGSPAYRAEQGRGLSVLDRRRWRKEAAALVRPGLQAADLHGGMVRAGVEKDLWHRLGGPGQPTVPDGLDEALSACDRVRADADLLEPVLTGTAGGAGLADLDLDELTARLTGLNQADVDLDNLPQRATAIAELDRLGLAPLVASLRGSAAGESAASIADRLEIAWLRGVLDQMGVAGMARLPAEASAGAGELSPAVAAAMDCVTSLAVSEHLPARVAYDCVLLLDANRIGLAEAVPAIARGRQTVVIGDPSGLGPAGLDLSVDAATPASRRPSLLSATAALPVARLDHVHRQPAALARLTHRLSPKAAVAPSWAVPSGLGDVVSLVHVPGGTVAVTDDGEETFPAQEVEQAVALIAEHARLHPEESLAVLTVSRAQAREVADVLRGALRRSPDLVEWLTTRREEPFVVTDLWHADEAVRDHVVLALGFAKTPHGRVVHRFGALDSPTGDALLAAGLGRARQRLSVLSCLHGADLDAERLGTQGGRRLARLLVDLEGRRDSTPPMGEMPVDPVLARLAAALTGPEVTVRPGTDPDCDPDLAVRRPGKPPIAVLWDGHPDHGYRSALAAALTRFGWTVRRVRADDIVTDVARVVATVSAT